MNSQEYEEIDITTKITRDLEYINNEIIAKQIDGNLCKWSRVLNTVSIIGLTPKQFLNYWIKQYKFYPEYLDTIMQACLEKLTNGLISREEMISKIQNSVDFESEKIKAIALLGGKYVKQ